MINYENFNGLKKNHSYQKFWKRSKLRIIINCNCSICFLFCSSVWFATLPLEASNIFVYYFAASFASFYDIPVWIQAVKIEQIWRFHDGSLVPGVFPISMSNNPEETHLRARGKEDFRSVMHVPTYANTTASFEEQCVPENDW